MIPTKWIGIILIVFNSQAPAQQIRGLKVKTPELQTDGCTTEGKSKLSQDLRKFLKGESKMQAKSLINRFCISAPEGESPCPLKISQGRVADFEGASKKRLGVVPVLACVAAHAEGTPAIELNDLLARLLDLHKEQFFESWLNIPNKLRPAAQKFEAFVTSAPDDIEDYQRRIRIFQSRLNLLMKAPPALSEEVKLGIQLLQENLEGAEQANAQVLNSAKLNLKSSPFFKKLSQRAFRLTKATGSRLTNMANEELSKLGLNVRFMPKIENRLWFLCPADTSNAVGCKMTPIAFAQGGDQCGPYGEMSVTQVKGSQWSIVSTEGIFNFNAAEFITPRAVYLMRKKTIVKFWILPHEFYPLGLSSDLRTLYVQAPLKTDMRTLNYLTLKISDRGMMKFITLANTTKLIRLKRLRSQKVKYKGVNYTLTLPCL